MEITGKVHCFFEQSGTFKNEFIKLGIPAEDYDIQNNFGETDHVIDLFNEIEMAWGGVESIFDHISKDDLIMAFFPCIYFCENNQLYFTGKHHNLSKMCTRQRNYTILQRSINRTRMYELCLKLFSVCDEKGLRMVVENPYAQVHFLRENFPYRPSIIDKDRTQRGDFFKKPSQYWFLNCTNTTGFTHQRPKEHKTISAASSGIQAGICSEDRSMISQDYARNFICDFILGKQQPDICPSLF